MSVAEENFKFFENKMGATEIATKEALRLVEDWVQKLDPKFIVEIGAGIGTITRLLSKTIDDKSMILAYEKNEWCRNRFWENFSFPNIELYSNLPELLGHSATNIDLLIVDDFLNQSETNQLVHKFIPQIVFIEGHRRMQQIYFARALYSSGLKFKYKYHGETSDSYKGGVSFVTSHYSKYKNYSGISNYSLVLSRICCGLISSKRAEIRSKISFRTILARVGLQI